MNDKETTDGINGLLYKQFFDAIETLVMNSTDRELELPGLQVKYERLGNHCLSNCSLDIKEKDEDSPEDEPCHLGIFIRKNSFKNYSMKVYNNSADREKIEEKMKKVIDNYDDIKEEYRDGFSPTEYPEFFEGRINIPASEH